MLPASLFSASTLTQKQKGKSSSKVDGGAGHSSRSPFGSVVAMNEGSGTSDNDDSDSSSASSSSGSDSDRNLSELPDGTPIQMMAKAQSNIAQLVKQIQRNRDKRRKYMKKMRALDRLNDRDCRLLDSNSQQLQHWIAQLHQQSMQPVSAASPASHKKQRKRKHSHDNASHAYFAPPPLPMASSSSLSASTNAYPAPPAPQTSSLAFYPMPPAAATSDATAHHFYDQTAPAMASEAPDGKATRKNIGTIVMPPKPGLQHHQHLIPPGPASSSPATTTPSTAPMPGHDAQGYFDQSRFTMFSRRSTFAEISFQKKPRGLFCTPFTSDPTFGKFMATTALDGELRIWNFRTRSLVKQVNDANKVLVPEHGTFSDGCWMRPDVFVTAVDTASKTPVVIVQLKNRSGEMDVVAQKAVAPSELKPIAAMTCVTGHRMGPSVVALADTEKKMSLFALRTNQGKCTLEQIMSPTPTGQKNLIMSLVNDKYNGRLYSGSLDKSLIAWDIETENVVNTRRFASPIRHVMQAKHDPNLCLVSHLSDANQFAIVDSRQHHASECTFGRPEPGKQRRHANPDWHSNGFTIVSPGFDAERIYFWDIRYAPSKSTESFYYSEASHGYASSCTFVPESNTVVSMTTKRYLSWIDYSPMD